jgi:hypothetical protein
LDFLEAEKVCQFCKSIIKVRIWEDRDPNREPVVISGLKDGKVECPV